MFYIMNNKETRSLIISLIQASKDAYNKQKGGIIANNTIIEQQELTLKKAEELLNSIPKDGEYSAVWVCPL